MSLMQTGHIKDLLIRYGSDDAKIQFNNLIKYTKALEQQLQQARKESAMAVLDTIADYRFELPDFIIEMVKSKYGLEGVRDDATLRFA